MRKTLRISLCSVFALLFAAQVFADGKDVTDKIWNADAEGLMKGWSVTFTTNDGNDGYLWKPSNHTEGTSAGSRGYWGMTGKVLECWGGQTDGMGNAVGANSISQVISNLPNGTYVFGAWTVATIQNHGEGLRYIPTKDDVEGVYMFANDDKVSIATNDPECNDSMPSAHAWKFNVATTVTDGTLKVGIECVESMNASFVCFDNAKLFYFGDVTTDAALLEMRKIDLQNAIVAADSLTKYPMAADSVATIKAAVEAAAGAATVADCEAAEEALRQAALYGRLSMNDYKRITNLIDKANDVLAQEWSDFVDDQIAALKEAVANAEAAVKEGAMDRAAVDEYVKEFENAINKVEIDELYDLLDALDKFVNDFENISADEPNLFCGDSHPGYGEAVGQYPESQLVALSELLDEANTLVSDIEAGAVAANEGVDMIARIKAAVANCIAMANKEPELPLDVIFIPDPDDPTKAYVRPNSGDASTSSAYMQTYKKVSETDGSTECFRYESPVISLPYQIDRLVMTVIHTAYNDRSVNSSTDGPYFNISEFFLYDEDGNKIDLAGSMFSSNAKEKSEGSYDGLCDSDLNTFFHSAWSAQAKPVEFYHNLSVEMPEGLMKFSIAIEVIWGDSRLYNMPTEVIFSGLSNAASDLTAAISDAEALGIVAGDDPGFFTGDFSVFFKALEDAKAVKEDENADDGAMYEAIEKLEAAVADIDGATINMPKEGVVYQLANQCPFVQNQGKVKNMTVFQDSIMWWADADPADEYQNFTFEKANYEDGADDEYYYYIKNVKTGKYLGQFTDQPGFEGDDEIVWGNNWHIRLSETPEPIRMKGLGLGQVHFWSLGIDDTWYGVHACNHNSGNSSTSVGSQGGGKGGDHPDGYSIMGICGPIVQWSTGVNEASAWYIQQQEELPLAVLLDNGFEKKAHHLYTPVQFMTIACQKACNFDNLQITNILGEPIECTITRDGYNAAVDFGDKYVANFYFNFDATVDQVVITGGTVAKPKIAYLQEAYDKVAGTEYTEGNNIGQIKDLSALNAALANAEKLLENGGTDDEYEAATAALNKAVAELQVVMPEAGKTYYIVNAYPAFYDNWGTEMALFANPNLEMLGWTYIAPFNPYFEWQFEYTDDTNFKLLNVGTKTYAGGSVGRANDNNDLVMIADGVTYTLVACGNEKFAILSTEDGENHNTGSAGSTWFMHPRNHNSGGTPRGTICFWGHDNPTKSEWYIREANAVTKIEEISVENESLSNFAKGTYDLTGRRVENPEKGLYIINGKKVLVK